MYILSVSITRGVNGMLLLDKLSHRRWNHSAAKSLERCMIRSYILRRCTWMNTERHDFRQGLADEPWVSQAKLENVKPEPVIHQIRACHSESTSLTGGTRCSMKQRHTQDVQQCLQLKCKICKVENIRAGGPPPPPGNAESGGSSWLIWGAWEKGFQYSWPERQTDTHPYCKYEFILLYSFWVLSTAVMCIPMPYLLPIFVYKRIFITTMMRTMMMMIIIA